MDFSKFSEKLKEVVSKKYVANIIVVMAVLVIALIAYSDFFIKSSNTKSNPGSFNDDVLVQTMNRELTEEEAIEEKLKTILETMRGVGRVEVMVTLEKSSEIIPASNTIQSYDTTEENDSSGGVRVMTSQSSTQNIVTSNNGNSQKPLVLKEIKPQVNGVIVVAEGAENIEVKAKLYDAVRTVLQVPGHKVQIYPKNL